MKVSREQAAANRERIVEVAGKLFCENGFDGIGLADLMQAAGLTHGGFTVTSSRRTILRPRHAAALWPVHQKSGPPLPACLVVMRAPRSSSST